MIKLPFYNEIRIEPKDISNLGTIISESKIGKVPLFFSIEELSENHQEKFLNFFFKFSKEEELNLYFPYPVFIISTLKNTDFFEKKLIFKKKVDLPEFYNKDLKRLRTKEINFLKKILLNSEKINNFDNQSQINFIKENGKKQKILFDLTNEFNFFQNILDELNAEDPL